MVLLFGGSSREPKMMHHLGRAWESCQETLQAIAVCTLYCKAPIMMTTSMLLYPQYHQSQAHYALEDGYSIGNQPPYTNHQQSIILKCFLPTTITTIWNVIQRNLCLHSQCSPSIMLIMPTAMQHVSRHVLATIHLVMSPDMTTCNTIVCDDSKFIWDWSVTECKYWTCT